MRGGKKDRRENISIQRKRGAHLEKKKITALDIEHGGGERGKRTFRV